MIPRYSRKQMEEIWSEESRWKKCLAVEAALARAQADLGIIPKRDAEDIEKASEHVTLERIKEIEREINHDLMAMVRALSEKSGSNYVHFGATSNDITDTALALQIGESVEIIQKDLSELKKVLLELAKKTRGLVCVGRTHGQQSVPTTYGLRFAIWACETDRHLQRLKEIKSRILVGQMTGAVGTQAAFGANARQIQERCMNYLGLKPVIVSNQIIQRDRHAEFLLFLALVAESLNKFAVNLRSWQRSEIGEVREKFGKNQVGSSTMSHKMNPIRLERVCGLSRIISANGFAAMRNVSSWDERDLTNSSPERIIFPDTCILADYTISMITDVLRNLEFDYENIERNLNLTKGLILAERIMIELTRKGMNRQDAHELMRKLSMKARKGGKSLKNILLKEKRITKYLSEEEIATLMDPHTYIGTAKEQVDLVLRKL